MGDNRKIKSLVVSRLANGAAHKGFRFFSGKPKGGNFCSRRRWQSMSVCPEKEALAKAYSDAIDQWTRTVTALGDMLGGDNSHYIAALARIDEARTEANKAKQAYLDHIHQHKC